MSTRTLPHRPRPPRQPKTASLASSNPTKPYSHFFFFNGHWSPSPELRAFGREFPSSLILWSLNSVKGSEEEVLVCNLVQGEGKEMLRRKLWPGALVRFEHHSNELTPFRRRHVVPLALPISSESQSTSQLQLQAQPDPSTLVCELEVAEGVLNQAEQGSRAVVFGMGRNEPAVATTFVQLIEERLLRLEVPDWDDRQLAADAEAA